MIIGLFIKPVNKEDYEVFKQKMLGSEEFEVVKNFTRVQKMIDQLLATKLVIYCAGVHTSYILNCCQFEQEIRICDSKKSGTFEGYKVERPSKELFAWADKIIIANFKQRDEIYESIVKLTEPSKIVSLYSEGDTDPLYTYRVEMDAEKIKDLCTKENYGTQNRYIAWMKKGTGENYEKQVEKNFFDAVTKNYYLKWINKGDRVLDIGAGTGRLSVEVHKKGGIVTAADTSADMLAVLHNKVPEIETVVVDGVWLPFEDNTFDKVVSCDAMIHFLNWKEFLKEHGRVVKSGGYIIHNLLNDDHLRNISEERWLRSSYMSGFKGYGATVARKELEAACEEIGDLQLVEMIPYGFFSQTAFSYGILTHQEMLSLHQWYGELCANPVVKQAVGRFEKEIVSQMPETNTALNICIFKKE